MKEPGELVPGQRAAARRIKAIKAIGALVILDAEEFLCIVSAAENPMVVHAIGGVLVDHHRYLVAERGLTFYTKCDKPLALPPAIDLVEAEDIVVVD